MTIFVSHKQCDYCGNLGHKIDMIKGDVMCFDISGEETYFHKKCYELKFGVQPCPCGHGYVEKPKNPPSNRSAVKKAIP